TKESGLYCADWEILGQNLDLFLHHLRSDWFDPRNFARNFSNDARNSSQSVNSERVERFQIRLDAGPSAAVRTGYRERAGNAFSHAPSLPIASTGQPSIASLQRSSSSGFSACL